MNITPRTAIAATAAVGVTVWGAANIAAPHLKRMASIADCIANPIACIGEQLKSKPATAEQVTPTAPTPIAPSGPVKTPRHDWEEEYAEICYKTRPATVADCPTD
jgi:hypothetical protein